MNKAKKVPSHLFLWVLILGITVTVILAFRGSVKWETANGLVLALTLIAIIIYTKYTFQISKTNSKNLEIALTPILTTELGEPMTEGAGDSIDFKTAFSITNHSVIHAVAKINFNAKLDNETLEVSKEYSGTDWWYLPAKKTVVGYFSINNLLKSKNLNSNRFSSDKNLLTLAIEVVYKKWSQKVDSPLLQNPVEKWHFKTYSDKKYRDADTGEIIKLGGGEIKLGKWVYEPTTFEIQFPVLRTIED